MKRNRIMLSRIRKYIFTILQKYTQTIQKKLSEVIDTNDIIEIREIRDVSPKKRMICISFKLPKKIAFGMLICCPA